MDIVQGESRAKPGWRPKPLVTASIVLHATAAASLLIDPLNWPFAVGAFVVNHLVLGVVGIMPRNALLGPNWSRLPASSAARGEVAVTIDDGPDPLVTPQVLDILDRHGAKATFFCIGKEALRYPELCREIVRRGHAVENHGHSHSSLFAVFGPRRTASDVDLGQQNLRAITGEAPRFFRPTAGVRSVFLDPVLVQRNLHLASWTRRGFDTNERRAEVVFRRLSKNLEGGSILMLHDGNAALTMQGVPVILEVLPRLLDAIKQAGLSAVTLRSVIP